MFSMVLAVPCLTSKSNFTELLSFGHSAFGTGVTVTIVETSNVGVKVGMVGRGVMEAVGVDEGVGVCVAVEVACSIMAIGVV
jgi:hypothetical protein